VAVDALLVAFVAVAAAILVSMTLEDRSRGTAAYMALVLIIRAFLSVDLVFGQSVGKQLFGLRVISIDGVGQAAARRRRWLLRGTPLVALTILTAAVFVDALVVGSPDPRGLEYRWLSWAGVAAFAVSVLGAVIPFGPQGQTWYDRLAGTLLFGEVALLVNAGSNRSSCGRPRRLRSTRRAQVAWVRPVRGLPVRCADLVTTRVGP